MLPGTCLENGLRDQLHRLFIPSSPIRKSIGINIDGKILTNLRFSDGIVLFANSTSDLSTMLNDLDAVGKKIGFQMNEKKPQWLRNRFCDQGNVTLEGRDLLEVNSYVYLGREVNMTNDLKPEIARRRRAGWAAFNSIKEVTNQLKDPKLRAHIFEASVIPAISYATEVWPDTKNTTTALRTSYRALEHDLRQRSQIRDLEEHIQRGKHRWGGQVIRRQDDRWSVAQDQAAWRTCGPR
ncbi:unnamed protein product [Caenorhabditis auriculariae]|uniref:Reverse transcriptase domain-containing protein n=1 Tax=Caenorhabditis auriculariae TaxID=2777116 RepID=A0A8S1HL21_9PELO|nr:unnamed protein product [Caenorhabditis auriculariae]